MVRPRQLVADHGEETVDRIGSAAGPGVGVRIPGVRGGGRVT
jgi:hypothetical protein